MKQTSVVFLLLAALAGCGASKGNVSGKVTFGARPVVYGTVTFIGSDGLPRSGEIAPDGYYEVRGVGVGEAKVAVASPDPWETYKKIVAMQRTKEAAAALTPPKVERGQWFPIPPLLGDPDRSGLTFQVAGGNNTHDIPLK
jgi:hypothetical protein